MADRYRLDVYQPLFRYISTGDPGELFFDLGERAKCMGLPPETFFPPNATDVRRAKAFCNGDDPEYPTVCPAREQCLAIGLQYKLAGVWGGTSESDRRRIRKKQKAAEAAALRAKQRKERATARARAARKRAAKQKPVKK